MYNRRASKRVLAIVLAGGEGKRLMPLTADRAKPAVPFAGNYRLIDFALSNVVNSGYLKVVVLTQYKSHSLDRHVAQTWRMSTLLGNYVTNVPAQQRIGKEWYRGSADAIFQSLNLIQDEQPDIVLVTGADNIYRMDFSQTVAQHIDTGAGCTVAAIRQPKSMADQFGVIDVQPGSDTAIRAFLEKPKTVDGLPDNPDEILASMGNYVFDTDKLIEALKLDESREDTKHDMGGDIVPAFVDAGDAHVYDFKNNHVAGETERDHGYWRDVGTLDSYYDAHMELVSLDPVFNLYNSEWPIFTHMPSLPPAKFVTGMAGRAAEVANSVIGAGVVASGAQVTDSVLGPEVRLHSFSLAEGSVLFDNVVIGRNATVHKAILDKNVVVGDGVMIGVDKDADLERGFFVTESGITVVGKGVVVDK